MLRFEDPTYLWLLLVIPILAMATAEKEITAFW